MAIKSKANQDVFKRANQLIKEGYDRKQAFAIAYRERDEDLAHLFSKPRKNPVKRKTAARTQKAAVGYVNRPSQITKKAPTKRLKKRRTVNLQSPRGVFPNPDVAPKYRIMSFSGKKIIGFAATKAEAEYIARQGRGRWIQEFDKQGGMYIRKNPSSVHFDIDVNSHNARGSKAKTRTNPARRKTAKQWIFVQKAYGENDWSYLGYFDDTPEGSKLAIEYAKAYHIKDPRAKIRVYTGLMK